MTDEAQGIVSSERGMLAMGMLEPGSRKDLRSEFKRIVDALKGERAGEGPGEEPSKGKGA